MGLPRLDGAGAAKMSTIEDAMAQVQKLHGIVEHMAMAARAQQGTMQFGQQLRRYGTPLVGQLKGQFGLIAEQVSAFLLIATRSGSDQTRVRALREGIAGIRQALEIASARVIEKHTIRDDAETAE